ncbi:hypothetical protein DICPUDRAFT_28638 [Dictyostelium purpureum]|uniref:Origin recognition complex subunit 4 n=1 Tax=Dictyostelium purpureum TaxID=5786 RepID=F0ZC92_DICPU|nr:uncharacterized protein DICPUDRAFT_28638 [Dictyostelium purpureum]EGC38481.1 hypothetical protein DICPUDRAFT_28638 [Dictyostelium purpureum]|eukprot:XP_003285039.1 hypothetical protein DICPUDRAFT_28638 [Dictyostelium purpureum]
MDNNQISIIDQAKRIIVDRISNPLYIPDSLIGYETEFKTICEKLNDAIIKKKSVSCLVSGPRSCGKSILIRYCLSKYNKEDYTAVEFSAVTHFNDNLAFKEIAKALNIKIERGESIFDTIEEIKKALGFITNDDGITSVVKRQKVIPVIVIINELDEIIKNGAKQNLLYSILDLSHYKSTPISFIGTSAHHEILDLFEKRIKSRFTQEMILIPKLSFNNIVNIMISLLSIPSKFGDKFGEKWNKSLTTAFVDKNVTTLLCKNYYHLFTRVPYYHNLILDILDLIDENNLFITSDIILSIFKNKVDPIATMLYTLTPLEYTILGCLSKIPNSQDEYISFSNLYDGEYKRYSESYFKTADQAKKTTTIQIIQKLISLGIIQAQSKNELGEFIKIKISISLDSIKNCASNNKSLPSALVKYITEWLQ